jgi:hypothetical protein
VRYTPADYPSPIVRMLVPGLEFHSGNGNRVGPRLRRHVSLARSRTHPSPR